MPIYEYECRACQNRFELFIRPSSTVAPEVPACPACRSLDLQRLLSAFAVNSEATQQVHLKQARKLNAPAARDAKHAEIEQMRHIEESHDH